MDIIEEIIDSLESVKNEKRLAYTKISCPTNMHILGVSARDLQTVLKNTKKQISSYSVEKNIELAKKLCRTNILECQLMACIFIGTDKALQNELTESDTKELLIEPDNWVSVDSYSIYISGLAWRNGILSTETIMQYLDSENFWYRRIAVVSTIALNQKTHGGKGDTVRTLAVCEKVINDRAIMVIKALSWALRELSKTDKQAVVDFLQKYDLQLHNLIKREVWNKINTGRKNPKN